MAGRNNVSLKFKTMAMCLSLTVALAGLSAYGLNVLKGQQETAAYATLAARAETLANAIAARFYEHYVDIKVIAQHPTLRSDDHAAVVRAFNAIAKETNTFALMLFVDLKGHLLAVNERTPEGEALDLPSLYARDFTQYEWFRAPIAGRTSDSADRHLHGTYVEPMNDLPAMSAALGRKVRGNKFSTAVHNEAGEIIGVLAGAADHRWYHEPFTQAYKTMKDQKFPHTSLMLLDRAGRALEHELGEDRLDEASMIEDFSRQMQEGQFGSFMQLARDGTEVMAGIHPLKSEQFADELGWAVAIQDSKSELLARAVEMQRLFYMALGGAMLFCLIGSYVFASRLGSSLTEVEGGLATSTRAIATAAAQLSASSTELSGAAAEQATAIQQTAASIDEVSAMAKKSAENAAQSQETSVVSRKAAEEGREAVQEMIRVIGAISESNAAITAQVEDGNRQISDIVKVIGEIGNKTKVINDIVFQTKLLSFNASVEAARAGEHGKGFAVVAEEVGNLARMSGDAAKEISAMLDSSIEKVESIVGQTQSRVEQLVVAGRARIESGSQVAATCGNSLSKILSLVQEVEGMVNEIASASNEQAQGVAEINRAMNSLDQVTQRNTTVAQHAAEGSRSLTQQAQDLTQIIAQLHLLVQGTAAAAGAEATAAAATAGHGAAATRSAPAAAAAVRGAARGGRARASSSHELWRRSEQGSLAVQHSGQLAADDAPDGPDYPPSRDDARFKNV